MAAGEGPLVPGAGAAGAEEFVRSEWGSAGGWCWTRRRVSTDGFARVSVPDL